MNTHEGGIVRWRKEGGRGKHQLKSNTAVRKELKDKVNRNSVSDKYSNCTSEVRKYIGT